MAVAPHRSASIDALRTACLTIWPGMTIYWIGDLAHQGTVSGHNPDDYTGVRAEMLDDDTDPEVRALDLMVGSVFTAAEGTRLVQALIRGVDRLRLYYVIYRSTIYRRATGFRAEPYGGANHNDHVHVSGHASDDANGSPWTSVLALEEEDMDQATFDKLLLGALTGTSADALKLQARWKQLPLQYPVTSDKSLLALHKQTAADAQTAATRTPDPTAFAAALVAEPSFVAALEAAAEKAVRTVAADAAS